MNIRETEGNTLVIRDGLHRRLSEWRIDPNCPDAIDLQNIRLPRNSCWGPVRSGVILARGLFWISTDRHGGIMAERRKWGKYLSREAKELATFPDIRSWYFFEEECDWNVLFAQLLEHGIDRLPAYMDEWEGIRSSIQERAGYVLEYFRRMEGFA